MTLTFNKKILPDKKVQVEVLANYEVDWHGYPTGSKQIIIGNLIFPTIQFWGRFIGALNRGALAIPDLKIIVDSAKSESKPAIGNEVK